MAEKRTKADKLQRAIERVEERIEARSKDLAAQIQQDTAPFSTLLDATEVEQEIRRRAFEHYEARGRQHGHDLDDWLRAKAEVARSKRVA